MTKKEIVRSISEETGLTQAVVKEIVQKTFDAILDTLAEGKRVELRNFGVFSTQLRNARTARNITTGEPVDVPARRVVRFRPSKEMERRVAEQGKPDRFSESGFMPHVSQKRNHSNHRVEKNIPNDQPGSQNR